METGHDVVVCFFPIRSERSMDSILPPRFLSVHKDTGSPPPATEVHIRPVAHAENRQPWKKQALDHVAKETAVLPRDVTVCTLLRRR